MNLLPGPIGKGTLTLEWGSGDEGLLFNVSLKKLTFLSEESFINPGGQLLECPNPYPCLETEAEDTGTPIAFAENDIFEKVSVSRALSSGDVDNFYVLGFEDSALTAGNPTIHARIKGLPAEVASEVSLSIDYQCDEGNNPATKTAIPLSNGNLLNSAQTLSVSSSANCTGSFSNPVTKDSGDFIVTVKASESLTMCLNYTLEVSSVPLTL
ncbi:MAG: hypothetical protein IPJ88_08945 [Myxococcales bacterium]|nr:MAG: hypothetical protein IPJ88_08945 [Myxococcales bacterium]